VERALTGGLHRWWETTRGAQNASRAPAKAAAQAEVAAQYATQMPPPSVGREMSNYAMPATLGAFEGGAFANMPQIHDALLPSENPNRRAWEQYRNTLPMDHPDRERAQAIIDSLPGAQPAQQRAGSFDGLAPVGHAHSHRRRGRGWWSHGGQDTRRAWGPRRAIYRAPRRKPSWQSWSRNGSKRSAQQQPGHATRRPSPKCCGML
jgi:hypothetical protein